MSANLLPWPLAKFFQPNTNLPLAGGKVYTYTSGTSTPQATYSDYAGTIPNTNPVILDANGQANIYLTDGLSYKINLLDASNVQIPDYPIDNVTNANFATSVLRSDLANNTDPAKGAALIGYTDQVAPSYLKTVSDIINGEEVSLFRFIPVSKHAGIYAGTNTDDLQTYFNDAFTGVSSSGRGRLRAPAGTYNLKNVTAPAGLKSFRGVGQATKFKAYGAATFGAFTPWFYFNGQTDIDLGDFYLDIDPAVYTQNHALYLGSVVGGLVSNIHMAKAGYIGIYLPACNAVTVDNIKMDVLGLYGIQADTSASALDISRIRTLTAPTGHVITLIGGIDHSVHDCRINGTAALNFGISLTGSSESIAYGNQIYTYYAEGMNNTDGHRVSFINNKIYCADTTHTDMGMSMFAQTANVYDCLIEGNTIYNSGKTGIGLASDSRLGAFTCIDNAVIGNKVFNPNRKNNASYTGIWCYGSLTSNNTVANNDIVDQTTNMKYGVSEYNNGDGNPSANRFADNSVQGAGLTGEVLLLSSNSTAYEMDLHSFTPVVTSTAGTITTASGTMNTKRRGKFVEVDATVTVTTNGTGSGAIQITTPFTSIVNGVLNGRANGVSGKQVNAIPSTGNLIIRNYDNTYPGANSEIMQLSGIIEIA